MSKPSEQLLALMHDVEGLEAENVRLNAALAKCNAELFDLRKRNHQPATRGNALVSDKAPVRALKLDIVPMTRKPSTLEDDVRKFLGMPPFANEKLKNDKRFLKQLDDRYGPIEVDVMIKRLRNADG